MASLGSATAHLFISIGDGQPVDIATFDIPFNVTMAPKPRVPVEIASAYLKVDPSALSTTLAGALREIARNLEGGN